MPSAQEHASSSSEEKVKGQAHGGGDDSRIEWEELFRSQYITGHSKERDDLLFYVKYDSKEVINVITYNNYDPLLQIRRLCISFPSFFVLSPLQFIHLLYVIL